MILRSTVVNLFPILLSALFCTWHGVLASAEDAKSGTNCPPELEFKLAKMLSMNSKRAKRTAQLIRENNPRVEDAIWAIQNANEWTGQHNPGSFHTKSNLARIFEIAGRFLDPAGKHRRLYINCDQRNQSPACRGRDRLTIAPFDEKSGTMYLCLEALDVSSTWPFSKAGLNVPDIEGRLHENRTVKPAQIRDAIIRTFALGYAFSQVSDDAYVMPYVAVTSAVHLRQQTFNWAKSRIQQGKTLTRLTTVLHSLTADDEMDEPSGDSNDTANPKAARLRKRGIVEAFCKSILVTYKVVQHTFGLVLIVPLTLVVSSVPIIINACDKGKDAGSYEIAWHTAYYYDYVLGDILDPWNEMYLPQFMDNPLNWSGRIKTANDARLDREGKIHDFLSDWSKLRYSFFSLCFARVEANKEHIQRLTEQASYYKQNEMMYFEGNGDMLETAESRLFQHFMQRATDLGTENHLLARFMRTIEFAQRETWTKYRQIIKGSSRAKAFHSLAVQIDLDMKRAREANKMVEDASNINVVRSIHTQAEESPRPGLKHTLSKMLRTEVLEIRSYRLSVQNFEDHLRQSLVSSIREAFYRTLARHYKLTIELCDQREEQIRRELNATGTPNQLDVMLGIDERMMAHIQKEAEMPDTGPEKFDITTLQIRSEEKKRRWWDLIAMWKEWKARRAERKKAKKEAVKIE